MKKQFGALLLTAVFFFNFNQVAFAARDLVITADKTSLEGDSELTISASSSGFTNGEKIYIKGAFFKDGSSNYFGLTKFNDNWIKNSITALSQREIVVGAWDNQIIVKPDFSDSGFVGPGDYKFKLGFYYITSGGNTSSVNWSTNDLTVSINSPPTSPPSPTPTKSTSTTTTSTSSSKNIPIKTPSPTKIPQVVVTKSPVTNSSNMSKNTLNSAKISHTTRTASEFARIKPITTDEKVNKTEVLGAQDKKTKNWILIPLVLFSLVLIILGGYLFYKKELKGKYL